MKRKKVMSHTPRLITRIVILMMGVIVALLHIVLFRSMSDWMSFLPFTFAMILLFDSFLLWWAVIFMTQSQVTLFEEGIELERGGSKIFSTWDNVSHTGIKGYGKNSRRGIFLHEKVSPDSKGLAEKLIFGQETDFIPIGQVVYLPGAGILSREIDMDKLLDSEFGQKLYELAPHLFEEYDEWKPKNRLEDSHEDEQVPDWLADLNSKESKLG